MRNDLDEILANVPKQASVATGGNIRTVLIDALETFPDAHNAAQAYTRALWHWYHGRQENSKRGSLQRLEENNAQFLERLSSLENEIKALRAMLADSAPSTPAIEHRGGDSGGM